MRVFAISDIHVDYEANFQWVSNLSRNEFRDDVLILAGDVTDSLALLEKTFRLLAARFKQVLYVPGNHELWVVRDTDAHRKDSFQKFSEVAALAAATGVSMRPFDESAVVIVPLLGWYDYSFGAPEPELQASWADNVACRWPAGCEPPQVAEHFAGLNNLDEAAPNRKVITFSHFVPRIDVMPDWIPASKRVLYPVLGSERLEQQLRQLQSTLHVYGHSHVNRKVQIEGVTYVNNAFGYPREAHITSKRLVCIHEV